ncbi:hypothetical protein ACHAWF_016278 [Thalassiosira exigua]
MTVSSFHQSRDEVSPALLSVHRTTEPTLLNGPKPRPAVDLASLDSKDFKDLRRRDSFLYYSIPEVRRAQVRGENVDHVMLARRYSAPPDTGSAWDDVPEQATAVRRSSCISFECHPDLVMAELLNSDGLEGLEAFAEEQGEDYQDPLDLLLADMTSARDEKLPEAQ